jgi:(p)ppGpp synthase/HD superfamily hydrolase
MMKARDFALTRHAGQTYGKVYGYEYHLDKVVGNLKKYGYISQEMEDAGYLHDVLEDTDTTQHEIDSLYGSIVGDLVFAVTALGSTRKEKTLYTVRNLKCFPEAIPLKMADRLANMQFSRSEYDAGRPRRHIEVYTQELPLYADMFQFTNAEMYAEMQKLCLKD